MSNDFSVYTFSMVNEPTYCHWSKNLTMKIRKNGTTIELNSKEIQELVKSLPKTIGGTY